MIPERQTVLADFVLEQWLLRPRMVRNWSAAGLVLGVMMMGLLISVRLSGAEGSDDIVVPAVIAGGLAVVCGLAMAHGISTMGALRRHELIMALRASPPKIDHVEQLTIHGRYGAMPALTFQVTGGGAHVVTMSEETRRELIEWLGHR